MLINKESVIFCVTTSILSGCTKSPISNVAHQTGITDFLRDGLLFLVAFIIGLFAAKVLFRKNKRMKNQTDSENSNDLYSTQTPNYDTKEVNSLKREVRNLRNELEESKEKLKASEEENEQLRNDLTAIKLSPISPFKSINLPVSEMATPSNENIVKIRYSKFADEKGVFPHTHLTSSDDGSCYYQLTIDEENRTGQFEPIISELNMHSFKNNKSMLLFPYCEIVNVLDFWSNIHILESGSLKPGDVEWTVENKCRIELV